MSQQSINEFLDYIPLGLKKWDTVHGVEFYSSEKIVKLVKNWVSQSPHTDKISDKLSEALDLRVINVGYENGSKLKFLATRIEGWISNKIEGGTLGYCSREIPTIYVILDSHVTLMGDSQMNIPETIVHELAHYCSSKRYKRFIETNMPTLLNFYDKYLIQFDNFKYNQDDLKQTIYRLSKYTDSDTALVSDIKLIKIFDMWSDFFKTCNMNDSTSDAMAVKVMAPFMVYFVSEDQKIHSDYRAQVKESAIKIRRAYKMISSGESYKQTVPGQEFIFPSEIIALVNQDKIQNRMVNLINSTEFGRF